GERRANGFVGIKCHLVFALRLGQRVLLTAEKTRVLAPVAFSGHGEDLQPHITTHFLPSRRQRRRLPLAREGDEPLARRRAPNGRRVGCALHWAVLEPYDATYLRDHQTLLMRIKRAAHRDLRKGEAITATLPRKRGYPGVSPARSRRTQAATAFLS